MQKWGIVTEPIGLTCVSLIKICQCAFSYIVCSYVLATWEKKSITYIIRMVEVYKFLQTLMPNMSVYRVHFYINYVNTVIFCMQSNRDTICSMLLSHAIGTETVWFKIQ